MAQQVVGIGSAPNDGTGDTGRAGATKINENFTELYSLLTVEDWHNVGDVGEPAFGTNWRNDTAGSGYADCSFYKDGLGIVRLQGAVEYTAGTGAGTVVFTLPAGYRPEATKFKTVIVTGPTTGYLAIATTGEVLLGSGDASGLLLLDDITFRAA